MQQRKPIYTKWWFWLIIVLIVGSVSNLNKDRSTTPTATNAESSKNETKAASETASNATDSKKDESSKTEKAKAEGVVATDVESFRKAFNKASETLGAKFTVKSLKVEGSGFQHQLTDSIYLNGFVNKETGAIKELLIMGAGDGTPQSGANLILSFGALIGATNPDLETNESGDIFEELGLMESNVDLYNLNKSAERNGIVYTIKSSKETGIWFMAQNATVK
ncbi:hypothetical protein [Paenibacillus sp. Leaf72]|uniref:hypothetical protein n=1 Tax=Paenibacillus sp. Leaf72 TaxID=1736234 RepID=UPI0006F8E52D|nr:hypothetical protein [Paenibacillus sp. Leaf72]KQO04465.1 hypothetical protein ASF12_13060 [Paenibacillus sp. Leaf72]